MARASAAGAGEPIDRARRTRIRPLLSRARIVAIVVASLSAPGCRGEPRGAPAPMPADAPVAWPALDEAELAAWVATAGYTRGVPAPLAIAPDGGVVFSRSQPRDPRADLYELDAAGKLHVIATAAGLLGAAPIADDERATAARGIAAIELSRDGGRILIPLAGRLFVIDRPAGTTRELAIGAHRDPRLAPDGRAVAFVRDGDLWIAAIPAAGPIAPPAGAAIPVVAAPATRLTQHPADRAYATAEPSARDFGRDRGFWWSPDSQAIAFQRTDARGVETAYLGDPRHPERPPVAVVRARSGTAHAVVDLGVVSIHGGAPRWITWDLARYPYLAHVAWPARAPLTLIVVGRDQTQLAALAADTTGALRTLVTDRDPAWLNVPADLLTWLPDATGFLWRTESHGAWSLEHRAADGALAGQVVAADVGLRRVVSVSPDGHDVVIEAAADPREQHVWRVPLGGGAATALTPVASGGVHRAWADHAVVIIASSQRAGGQITTVARADAPRVELPSIAEHPRAPATQIETAALDDHVQDVAITRPRAFDPGVRYPVVLRIAADPDAKAVRDALDDYALDQWYADAGFIVVRTDGRGTPGHDRLWQRAIAGDVLTLPINDQLGALKQLGARFPALDPHRAAAVGDDGPGFGGSLAALAGLTHPEAFAAAIGTSPITDWTQLDAAYAERYLRSPAINAEGYRRASAAAYAEQLQRPLLIVQDLADDRAPLGHALGLIDALSAAGKRAELATLPAAPDAAIMIAHHKLVLDFLRQHLGPPVRPAVMPKPRTEEEEEEEEERAERAHRQGAGSNSPRDHRDPAPSPSAPSPSAPSAPSAPSPSAPSAGDHR